MDASCRKFNWLLVNLFVNIGMGSYTFVSKQWKDLEYPVDLYIKWNSRHFDEMSIYTYGKVGLPNNVPDNVKIIEGVDPNDNAFKFYAFGPEKAMQKEWAIL